MTLQTDQFPVSRRNFLQHGLGAIGMGTFTAWLGSGALMRRVNDTAIAAELPPAPQILTTAPGGLTPAQAWKQLVEGNDRYVTNQRQNPHQDLVRMTEVAKGQAPFAAVLSCADSRVVPELVFDQGIGDLFVVRVAGNVAAIEDIASEEYATAILGTPLLLVLGHERCGAVDAALHGGVFPGVMDRLVTDIYPAIAASEGQPGDRLTNAVKANVLLQVQRVQTSPVIAKRVREGKLKVVGGYYDLDTGKVEWLS